MARYASGQIELAELDASRARLDRAEVLALRAQISPHFIYNALNTIASFVRTDPDRARELILEFADFTRYSFRAAGEYTTLADELRNIDRYLTLERARFGDALTVKLQVAPEVLNVVLPFLALQPLVENAVRHGIAGQAGGGTEIVAADEGTDCVISVEDDGVGMDPELLRSGARDAVADGAHGEAAHVGLANVDDRLRAAFGNDYGLVVETAPGAGTKVEMRVPKFRPGVSGRRRCVRVSHMTGLDRAGRGRRGPALDELAYLLAPARRSGTCTAPGRDHGVAHTATGAPIDAVFLDINMPGLDGLELAGILAEFAQRPAVVFVTAHDDRAVAAFDLGAVDYLLKPIREERLAESVRRIVGGAGGAEPRGPADAGRRGDPGRTRRRHHLVPRSSIGWVEAEGDYARLHTASGSHLVRIPLSTWKHAGRTPGSCGCTARTWWRCGWSPGSGPRRRGAGVPARQRRVARGRTAGQPPARPELHDRLVRAPSETWAAR